MQKTTYNWKRNTIAFLTSQAISILGSSLVQYAIMWHITLSTKSGAITTLAIICGFLPTFFLSPFAGVWADRYNRKLLIALADGGIALATLVLAVLFLSGYQSIGLLLVVMGVRALGSAVQQPCINAMLPDMVPAEHLSRINGVNSSLTSLITLVSPMLSGALMGFLPLGGIFFIDVATAAIAIAVLVFAFKLPEREAKPKPEAGAYFTELKQGFSYILKAPFLRAFFGFCIVFWLMTGPVGFLTPLQVARNYGDAVWRLTSIEVLFSVGMLVGGIIMSTWGGFKNRLITVALAGMLMSLGTLAFGLPIPFAVYCVVMALLGLFMPILNTPLITLLQEKVEPDYMGRVFSIMNMLSSSLMPLSMMVFGPLADTVPIEYLMMGTGGVLLVTCIVMIGNKTLLSGARKPEALEGGTPE